MADDAERIIHDLELRQRELEARCLELQRRFCAVEAAHQGYADFYDSLPIACCQLDLEGRVQHANHAAAAIFGARRGALLGKQLWSLAPAAARHELQAHVYDCLTRRCRASREVELRVAELGLVSHQVVSSPLIARDGRLIGCKTVLSDVSSLKRAELRLRFLAEASAALSTSFDLQRNVAVALGKAAPAFGDFVFADLVDDRGQPVRTEVAFGDPGDAELAARLGSAPGRLLGLAGPELFTVAAAAGLSMAIPEGPHRAYVVDAIAPRSVMLAPVVARGRALGCLVFVMAGSGRVHGPADLELASDLASRIGMAMDNARLYREAQAAVQARQDVLSTVSHDLKTPLASIQLIADAMLRATPPTEGGKSRGQLERIRVRASHLKKIVDDLLDASSIDAGRLSLDPHQHSLDALISEALELLDPHAKEKGVELLAEPAPQGLEVYCDRHRMQQVFANVIGNAVKFTPAGGRVTVIADFYQGMARVSVRDTGPGVSSALLARLFERYSQAKETASKGNGLGLYISKGILEGLGGRIWIESEPGEGTCVRFTLPPAISTASRDQGRLTAHKPGTIWVPRSP